MERKMKDHRKRDLLCGLALLAAFALWTVLVRHIDVQKAGPNGTEIGFAALNVRLHRMLGVHMLLYTITDWLGLVPIAVCMGFGVLGLVQWAKRRSLRRVDPDILLLGAYYALVILCYLLFEAVPINYRPVLIDGRPEASYPSSTVLLVLSVMPTLKHQSDQRIAAPMLRKAISVFVIAFSSLMVIGRLASGVHWATDILGSVFLSFGLYGIYRFLAAYAVEKKADLPSGRSNGVL